MFNRRSGWCIRSVSLVSLRVERRAYIFPAEWWWWSVLWTPRRSSACPSLSWPGAGKVGPAATDRKLIRWVFCLQQDGATDGCGTAELAVWGLKNTECGHIYSISIKLAPALEFSILLNTNYYLRFCSLPNAETSFTFNNRLLASRLFLCFQALPYYSMPNHIYWSFMKKKLFPIIILTWMFMWTVLTKRKLL